MQVSNFLPALMDLQATKVTLAQPQLLRAEQHLRFFTDSESPNLSYACDLRSRPFVYPDLYHI